ncbi:adenosylmethionine decarboxylase [Serratia fonticola]|uniref:adenosylmethionine decarboxylase n=1 Tax=Serratia fonticola TaxID=47917 RepID=UPI001646B3BC|nr:adenosylmethionine decarboxylase [Serratia fonticola]MBC3228674.1 adenosylmethionine decarboxylase [Serratia fonticola]
MNVQGFHCVWDIVLKDSAVLKDASILDNFFREALKKSGFSIIGNIIHKFTSEGEGITGVYLLSGSHLAFHTYPESNYISIDVYTCGRADTTIYHAIEEFFSASKSILMRTIDRGSLVSNSMS